MSKDALTPKRGLDHATFTFRKSLDPSPFAPPGGVRLVFALSVVLQRFHLDQPPPFPVPGMLDRPYPDLGNVTQREVGHRDGLWRIAEALDRFGMSAAFVVEQDALPLLVDSFNLLSDLRHCIVAGGLHATRLHTKALSVEEERRLISDCKRVLETTLARSVCGWRSPGCSQSFETLSLLSEQNFLYCGDFNNDDRPYLLKANANPMVAVPMHHFSSDLHAVFTAKQSIDDYFTSRLRGIDWLLRHTPGAVIMPMVIHPWIMGAPHRFRHFEAFLGMISRNSEIMTLNVETIARSYLDSTNADSSGA